jgi:hypothetical protein
VEHRGWKADPDWDWTSAAEDSPEDLRAPWQSAVERSRTLVHPIEEYARHNGHADLLREAIAGQIAQISFTGGDEAVRGAMYLRRAPPGDRLRVRYHPDDPTRFIAAGA